MHNNDNNLDDDIIRYATNSLNVVVWLDTISQGMNHNHEVYVLFTA